MITNICTTRTVDDVARAHGASVIRTRVGQAYVLAALADERGVLGGEGSGSVALPEFSNAFDGFLMMALVLEAMAESGRSVSALLGQLPRYGIVKRSVPCGSRDGYRAIDALKDHKEFLGEGVVDMTDGLRVDWEDSWVHVRTSQTQQLVRVIAEATTKERAEQRADDATRVLQQIV